MLLTYDSAGMGWACAVLFAALSALGCQADGKFPCGSGTCELATEICIIGGSDRCSTCVPRPTACDTDASCECLPTADDPSWGAYQSLATRDGHSQPVTTASRAAPKREPSRRR